MLRNLSVILSERGLSRKRLGVLRVFEGISIHEEESRLDCEYPKA
jgi:hypothetical protein